MNNKRILILLFCFWFLFYSTPVNAWYQTSVGNVFVNQNSGYITNFNPHVVAPNYFSREDRPALPDLRSSSGFIYYAGNPVNIDENNFGPNGGSESPSNQVMTIDWTNHIGDRTVGLTFAKELKAAGAITSYYTYYRNQFLTASSFGPNTISNGNYASCNGNTTSSTVHACNKNGNVSTQNNPIDAPNDGIVRVFLINGNLTVNDSILYDYDSNGVADDNGMLIFIVSGNITFQGSNRDITGIFITDGDFIFPNPAGPYIIRGMMISRGEMRLNQAEADVQQFIYRPEYLRMLPMEMRDISSVVDWQEVRP